MSMWTSSVIYIGGCEWTYRFALLIGFRHNQFQKMTDLGRLWFPFIGHMSSSVI